MWNLTVYQTKTFRDGYEFEQEVVFKSEEVQSLLNLVASITKTNTDVIKFEIKREEEVE